MKPIENSHVSLNARIGEASHARDGEAVTQMDKVTQQNAALVEESAETVDSLSRQAEQLVTAMAVFRLSESPQPSQATAAA